MDGWPKKSIEGLDETDFSQRTPDPSMHLGRALAEKRVGVAVLGTGN
jgi:hypothetical protein